MTQPLMFVKGVGGPSVSPINKTYAELLNMSQGVGGIWLVPGQKYRITDFRTRHAIPNTFGTGSISGYDDYSVYGLDTPLLPAGLAAGDTVTMVGGEWDGFTFTVDLIHSYGNGTYCIVATGTPAFDANVLNSTLTWPAQINVATIEPLVVTATTASSIGPEAYSESYPQDIIQYELIDTSAGGYGDRGRIIRREDTVKKIIVTEDWRNVIYRRGLDSNGLYTLRTDFSLGYQDSTMFDFSVQPERTFNNTILGSINSSGVYNLCNTVFGPNANNNVFLSCDGCTFGRYAGYNTIKNISVSTFGENCFSNSLDAVSIVVAGDYFGVNKGHGLANCTIGVGFSSNTTRPSFSGVTVGDQCYLNDFGPDFTTNTIGDNFQYNRTGGSTSMCTFGNNIVACDFPVYCISMVVTGPANFNSYHSMGTQKTFPAQDYKEYSSSRSTFTADMDWDWSSDMTTAQWTSGGPEDISYAGIVTLHGEGGTLSTNAIQNLPDQPVRFIAGSGYTFTFTVTAYAVISGDGYILGQADIVLDGDKGDWAEFEKISITNGNGTFSALKLVASSIY